MRELGSEFERREHLRHRPSASCELFLGGRSHEVKVVDLSRGGAFVQSEVGLWPGALVRVRLQARDRYAIVLRERHVPHRLRDLLPRGFALRWIGTTAAH